MFVRLSSEFITAVTLSQQLAVEAAAGKYQRVSFCRGMSFPHSWGRFSSSSSCRLWNLHLPLLPSFPWPSWCLASLLTLVHRVCVFLPSSASSFLAPCIPAGASLESVGLSGTLPSMHCSHKHDDISFRGNLAPFLPAQPLLHLLLSLLCFVTFKRQKVQKI